MNSILGYIYWKMPAVLCAAFILFLTSHPTLEAPNLGLVWQDKLYHCIAYFGFGLTLSRAISRNNYINFIAGFKKILLIGFAFAAFDEAHQIFIPTRSADILDATADGVGVLVATFVYFVFLRWNQRRVSRN